jgi:hypothetical protein
MRDDLDDARPPLPRRLGLSRNRTPALSCVSTAPGKSWRTSVSRMSRGGERGAGRRVPLAPKPSPSSRGTQSRPHLEIALAGSPWNRGQHCIRDVFFGLLSSSLFLRLFYGIHNRLGSLGHKLVSLFSLQHFSEFCQQAGLQFIQKVMPRTGFVLVDEFALVWKAALRMFRNPSSQKIPSGSLSYPCQHQ